MRRFFIIILFFFAVLTDFVTSAEHVVVVCPQKFYRSLEPWIRYRSSQGYTVHVLSEPFDVQNIKNRIQLLAEQVSLSAIILVGKETIPSPQIPCRIVQHFGKESTLASDDWYADQNNDGLPDIAVGRFTANTVEELDSQIQKTIRYETEIPVGIWCRQLQIVAGIGHFSPLLDNLLESTTRYLLSSTLPESYEIPLLHANWKSSFCPAPADYQKELFETINRSPLFWVYFGHGHPQMLDPFSTPLGPLATLHVNNFPQFHCRKSLPIVFLFCCYGGVFDLEPYSLAEKLIHQPEGPVAVFAASRTTMPYGMSVLGTELLQEYVKKQHDTPNNNSINNQPPTNRPTFGSLILHAKQQALLPKQQNATESISPESNKPTSKNKNIRQTRSIRQTMETLAKTFDPFPKQLNDQIADHIAMFHLFGDPLLQLPIPKKIQLNCLPRIKSGERLHLEGSLDNSLAEQTGTVNIELIPALYRLPLHSSRRNEFRIDETTRQSDNKEYFRSNHQNALRYEAVVSNGSFSFDLPISPALQGDYNIRAFFVSKQEFAIGCVSVSVLEVRAEP
ncbi:MAG: C25 family cysteine peptidase [Planctomycetaceae bacterium]|jgi:hypothetical protein|nr:C25 family cysteine peptidase [Planctomycetaceae bacterium]